ncbi:hypothetical protein K458DRAFT_388267 [Lentithecium fluviatile CBS 122367]|uniref:Uncharacterized protein n=1 Tax=Lentithecium fluviatile CBS 122367 TaxID=1168545 RepID=A0A6G1J4E0_9PLEO|nr:hypothetical protein K458DRAFT_388267 [Lentithecium fluviatile CBS 122367]
MSELTYTSAVEKGKLLMALMTLKPEGSGTSETTQDNPQSRFTTYTDLEKWGYIQYGGETEPSSCLRFECFDPLEECLRSICDFKGTTEEWTCEGQSHEFTKTIDGVEYLETNAFFQQVIHPRAGILIAHGNNGPAHMGRLKESPITTVPPLRHWSDVAFLQLLNAAETSTSTVPESSFPKPKLNYIIRAGVQCMPTVSVVKDILATRNMSTLPAWPGISFYADDEVGGGREVVEALLGTPNGSGVAYMVAQHNEMLGWKEVHSVTIFYSERDDDLYRWPTLLFSLRDVGAAVDALVRRGGGL